MGAGPADRLHGLDGLHDGPYCAAHGDLLAAVHAQETFWHREFFPLEGAARGLRDSVLSVRELLGATGVLPVPAFGTAGQLADPTNLAIANLTDTAFLAAGVVATVGALRRLPLAYGLYAAATVAVTVSTFYPYEPLASVPRFLLVVFPLQIWLALRLENRRAYLAILAISSLLMAFFAARFATWHWVA